MNGSGPRLIHVEQYPKVSSVLYTEEDELAWVELNRPMAANSIDLSMISELRAIWSSLSTNTTVKGVVLTGTGPEAFTVGLDSKLVAPDTLSIPQIGPREFGVHQYLVVAMNGIACREARVFLSEADAVVAAEHTALQVDAYRSFASDAMTMRGNPTRAGSDMVSAADALTLGLVDEVVPLSALRQTAKRFAVDHLQKCSEPSDTRTDE